MQTGIMRLDILIFALLAGYMFFRLWRVLGMRIEVEKKTFSPEEVIVLRNATPITPVENIATQGIKDLQQIEPQFDPEHFIQAAERMLIKIVKAFADGNEKDLRFFVSPPLCEVFEAKIKERQESNQVRHVDVLSVQGRITNIDIPEESQQQNTPVRIFVTFDSEQIIYTEEADGSSYDNPLHLPTRLSDNWVFVRMIGSSSPVWHVENTTSQNYRSL